MTLLAFGTGRGTYDPILIDFVNSCDGKYIPHKEKVGLNQQTKWEYNHEQWLWDKNPICVVGTARGIPKLLTICHVNNIDYYYLDHAYFGSKKNTIDGKFRILKNNRHITNIESYESRHPLPIKITKEYYQKGDDILICASTDITQNYYSSKLDDWINNVIRVIQPQTDRKIIIRNKNETIPLDAQLKNAWCVITPQSTVVIEALCKGIPCIDSSYGCGVDVTSKSLDLNELFYPDEDLLYSWLCTLNNYSFTREEISSGFAWSKINDNK